MDNNVDGSSLNKVRLEKEGDDSKSLETNNDLSDIGATMVDHNTSYLQGIDSSQVCSNNEIQSEGELITCEKEMLPCSNSVCEKADLSETMEGEEPSNLKENNSVETEENENSSDGEVGESKSKSYESNVVDGEEDRLLTDISLLIDGKSTHDEGDSNSKGKDLSVNVNSENKSLEKKSFHENLKSCETIENNNKAVEMLNITEADLLKKDDYPDIDDTNGGKSNKETDFIIAPLKTILSTEMSTGVTENKSDDHKKVKSTESAFQRLASLGVIAEEKLVVETKESALMKLASRGAISITPSGGGCLTSTVSSSVSITPTKPKTKVKSSSPGLKQKSKKIKIDPGKSMDIDKDFNNLISFLSRGNDELKTTTPNPTVKENVENVKVISNIKIDPEPEHVLNDSCIHQSTSDNFGLNSGMDVDDRSMHETDSESHDGSKSVGHSSDHAEDNEERVTASNSKLKNVIEEGSAEILLSATKNVFYNKVQEFNRDMSIAALTVFSEMHQQDPRTRNRGKKRKAGDSSETVANGTDENEENVLKPGKKTENGITILEALSATGLRSIRYAREIPGVKQVIANDLSEDAVESIKKNIEHNAVQDLVSANMSDAALLMYQRQAAQEWYDAVDLDPYGCPSRFLDSAVQAVRDGGLLLVTCTDMAVLAGNSPETCHVKYGAVSVRSPACHEMALRIALQSIESHANRYGRYIVPLLSFSADFYIRLIVQVYTSPVTCKKTTSKLSMVYQCCGCYTFTLHPLGQVSQSGGSNPQPKFSLVHGPPVNTTCFHCYHKHYIAGPIWSAPIYNNKFLESMLKVVEKGMFATSKRMQGMLEVIREELPDVPLYYTIAGLCTKLHCQAIPLIDIRSAILNAGYRVSSSHTSPTAIKTNAPSKVVWDIMRCWVHMNPVSQKRLTAGSVSAAIILEPPLLIANFDIHPKARPSSSMRKLLRYQPNPEKHWGPGTRARLNTTDDIKDEKRKVNQNKNKNKKNIDIIEVVTIDDEDETMEEASAPEIAPTTSASAT